MKLFAIALAATLAATVAHAQDTTVIKKEGMMGNKTTKVIRHSDDSDVSVRRKTVVRTGSVGCSTKTVKKTNDMGDTVTKSKSSC
ncbi:hypothetical protein GCM10007036_39060 [Alsobacter metallidurans]|uniref:Uncharacterized protein n=1 Tax=Alsobacter metallidurans TaxID=340221 RepID=A0A917MJH8_9HYPH|nr:hypothetical protein [Alsobacter metallidurans]GGH29262.1 hypothetical protein GCM10007036_39060 [Alsobacter metallidurans]